MSKTQVVAAAVGLAFEARIAAGPGVLVLGRDGEGGLAASAERAIAAGCRGLISFGIAGGLAPHLQAGACIVATGIADGGVIWPTCSNWSAKLLQLLAGTHQGVIAGVDAPVHEPSGKSSLHENTGAIAVDMESHLVARLAAQHDVPFVALRVIADPAHRALPQAALVGMRPDGRADAFAVLRALARQPKTLPALLRTAADAAIARSILVEGRKRVGRSFGLLEESVTRPLPAAFAALHPAQSQPA